MNLVLNSFSQLSIKIQHGFKKYSPGVTFKRNQKMRKNDPNFKLAVKLKTKPNWKSPDLIFPMNLPLRLRYVYKPVKNVIKLQRSDFINFKEMDGNEILINFELASGLNCLSKLPKPENVDWNQHEWIEKCVQISKKKLQHFRWRELAVLSVALDRLQIKDDELWKNIEFHTNRMLHKYYANAFGKNFKIFINRKETDEVFKNRLISLIPVHLTKMNSQLVMDIYDLVRKHGLMTTYLFDDHFHQIFWRRHKWFGIQNMSKIVDSFIEMSRYDEPQVFDTFLSQFHSSIDTLNESDCQTVINCITKLKEFNPKFEQPYKELMEKLPARLEFCSGKLKNWENSLLYKIVQTDLEYFKQRERSKLEQETKSQ